MKKISVLIVSLLMLSACAENLGKQTLVCPTDIAVSPRDKLDGDDLIQLDPVYRDDTIKYFSDNNYITAVSSYVSFEYDEEIEAMVEEEFNGDKQAWLDWLNKEERYWLLKDKFEETDGVVEVDVLKESPERPSGWRGLIVPGEYNFDKVKNDYLNFRLCEVDQ